MTQGRGARTQRAVQIGGEIFRRSTYGSWHPLRIARVSTVRDLSAALGWLPPGTWRAAPLAKPAALSAWHEPDYLEALLAAERDGTVTEAVRRRHGLGTPSNPVFGEMYRRPATAAGGSLLAADLLMSEGGPRRVHNPAGGTHHGLPGRASGFCYLNDPVLAILRLRVLGARRVAYLDLDAHHPDGVVLAFAHEPDVLLISLHEEGRWPRSGPLEQAGAGNVWNLPLPRGAGDGAFDAALSGLIAPLLSRHGADAVVLQCGADSVAEDPLSGLLATNGAYLRTLRHVMSVAPRLLVLGGGGYNPYSVARLWTAIWGTLAGRDVPERLPPAAEAVLRAVVWEGHRLARDKPEHWFTTLLDAPRAVPAGAAVEDRIDALRRRADL